MESFLGVKEKDWKEFTDSGSNKGTISTNTRIRFTNIKSDNCTEVLGNIR